MEQSPCCSDVPQSRYLIFLLQFPRSCRSLKCWHLIKVVNLLSVSVSVDIALAFPMGHLSSRSSFDFSGSNHPPKLTCLKQTGLILDFTNSSTYAPVACLLVTCPVLMHISSTNPRHVLSALQSPGKNYRLIDGRGPCMCEALSTGLSNFICSVINAENDLR